MEEEIAPATTIKVTEKNFLYVEELKAALTRSESNGEKFLLLCEQEKTTGAVGLMNCIKQEPGGANARYLFWAVLLNLF